MLHKKLRVFTALILSIFFCSICVSALASSTTIDNLQVQVVSDKSRYEPKEMAIVTVEVTNQNDFPVLDVNVEGILGKGLILAKNTEAPPAKEIILPGEKAKFVFNLALFEVPAMGDSQNLLRDGLIVIAGLLVLLILIYVWRKQIKKKILPMLLCLLILSSLLPFGVMAQDAGAQANTVSLNIYFGTTSYPFTAKVTYGAIDQSLSIGTLASDEEFFPADQEYPVLFTLPVISALTLGNQDVAVYDSEGKQIAYLNDKGQNGDEYAGDYIYSSNAMVSASVQTSRDYYAMVKGNKSNVLTFYYFDEITPEEEAQLESISQSINQDVLAPFTEDGFTIPEKSAEAIQAVLSYAQKLQEQGLVLLIVADEESVWMKFTSGLELLYFNTFQDVLSGGASSWKVATFEPSQKEFPTNIPDDAATLVSNTFRNYAFSSNLNNQAVDLQSVKDHFRPNSVILWFGHGGYNKKIHSSVWTTIEYAKLTSKLEEADKISGRIIKSAKGKDTGLTSKFFDHYLGQLNNSVIYLNICSGGKDSVLADVLLKKGARAIVTNTDITAVPYATGMMKTIVELLVTKNPVTQQYTTLGSAVNQAHNKHEFLRVLYNLNISAEYIRLVNTKTVIFGGDMAHSFRLAEDKSIGTISGKVLEAPTFLGIPSSVNSPINSEASVGTAVSLYKRGSNTMVSSTTTNIHGTFEINAPAGRYTMKIKPSSLVSKHQPFETEVVVIQQSCNNVGTYVLIPKDGGQATKINGRAINAKNGSVIEGVNLILRHGWNSPQGRIAKQTATNSSGGYSLSVNPGHYTLTAQKNGYVFASKSISVTSQAVHDFSMTPASLEDSYRVVLSWGETPYDLDAHVAGLTQAGNNFHVYYQNKTASDGNVLVCDLDVDDTDSFGPETITLKPQHLKPYYYYIYNYSDDDSIANSQAKVEVFKGNRLIRSFNIPVNQGDGRYWNLFAIVNGNIITNNTVTVERNINYAN